MQYIDEVEGIREFIRTPDEYGFATLSFTPNKRVNLNLNYVFTGPMKIPHFGGAPNQLNDEIIVSNSFSELSAKFGYIINQKGSGPKFEVYTGIKNITNSYQDEFDVGKNRDSNFVYGPGQPRTFYVGFKIRS